MDDKIVFMETFLHVTVSLQSVISISGPGDSYEGIAWSMKRAYLRVVMSHGGQEAFDTILQRLPLSPQDFHVTASASEIAGWNESFLERPSAKSGRARSKTNQGEGATVDIGLALLSAAARPKAAAPAPPPRELLSF